MQMGSAGATTIIITTGAGELHRLATTRTCSMRDRGDAQATRIVSIASQSSRSLARCPQRNSEMRKGRTGRASAPMPLTELQEGTVDMATPQLLHSALEPIIRTQQEAAQ